MDLLTRMDVVQFSLGLYSVLLLIRGCVSSYVIDLRPKTGIWETTEKPCHKRCKYGYDADVEGNRMCKCLDPCAHIYCPFEGTQCVVRKTDKCRHGQCKYEATCKGDWSYTNLQKLKIFSKNKYTNEVYNDIQGDSSDVTNLCSRQPSIDRYKNCGVKRPWYFYDGLKGVCVRFKGCYQQGEFFSKRRDCNKSCLKKRKSPELEPLIDNKLCTMAPVSPFKCKKLRRVWYYDQERGRCVKSRGCDFSGNSFKRRIDCINSCERIRSRKQQRKQGIQFVS